MKFSRKTGGERAEINLRPFSRKKGGVFIFRLGGGRGAEGGFYRRPHMEVSWVMGRRGAENTIVLYDSI